MRAAVILLLVAAATAQRFVLPPGHADILSYCNATYAYMDRADIAALDAKYDRLAPGVTPVNASGGQVRASAPELSPSRADNLHSAGLHPGLRNRTASRHFLLGGQVLGHRRRAHIPLQLQYEGILHGRGG